MNLRIGSNKVKGVTSAMSDEEIMCKVRDGELDLMRLLFERYNVRLYNFFWQNTNRDKEVSLDLTQNVFYRMMKYRNGFDQSNKFISWMYQIARNILRDHWKKNKIIHESFEDNISTRYEQTNIEDEERKEQHDQLKTAMSKLNPEYRELIVMSKFQGMKHEDIADAIGTTHGAVKVKVFRAINKLRELYFQ